MIRRGSDATAALLKIIEGSEGSPNSKPTEKGTAKRFGARRNLIRVKDVEVEGLPFKVATFYKWIFVKRHKEIFVRMGRNVFIDVDKFNDLMEKGRLSNE
jgi:hypothetical protein